MGVERVTQRMVTDRAYSSLQTGRARLAQVQQELSSGRVLNRPSDSPTDTASAMRVRAATAAAEQHGRNAEDGKGWLGTIDSTLTSMVEQVRRGRELGMQGLNAVNQAVQGREALAAEVEQLRASLLSAANTSYLGRPVFGGVTSGTAAYDATGAFVGTPGTVERTISTGVRVPVNVDGPDVFGPDGASLFDQLDALANALRSGDVAGVQTGVAALDGAMKQMTSAQTDVGTRYGRFERAALAASDLRLSLTDTLSKLENVDIARATIDLSMQELAYQTALASTARLVQPSLTDFLR